MATSIQRPTSDQRFRLALHCARPWAHRDLCRPHPVLRAPGCPVDRGPVEGEPLPRVGQPGWRRATFRVHGDPLSWNSCWPTSFHLRPDLRDWGFRAGLRHLGAQIIFRGGAQEATQCLPRSIPAFIAGNAATFPTGCSSCLQTSPGWGGVGEGRKVGGCGG